MDFLNIIKRDLQNPDKHRGMRTGCIADTRALEELVRQFERLDAIERASTSDRAYHIEQLLAQAIKGVFHHNNQSSERVLLIVMEVLQPLMKERDTMEYARRHFR